jgi:integrase
MPGAREPVAATKAPGANQVTKTKKTKPSPSSSSVLPEHGDAFLGQLQRFSPRTRTSYQTALLAFERFAQARGLAPDGSPCPTAALKEETLVGFYDWLCEAHPAADDKQSAAKQEKQQKSQSKRVKSRYSDATIRLYLTVVVRFLKWLAGHRYLPQGLQVEVMLASLDDVTSKRSPGRRTPRPRKADPRIGALLSYYAEQLQNPPQFVRDDPDSFRAQRWRLIQLRNHALLQTLYSTAGRVSEIIALRCGDVRAGPALIEVTGKGNKTRLVVMTDEARSAIEAYLDERLAKDDEPLFVSHGPRDTGCALHAHTVWTIVNDAGQAVLGTDGGRSRRRAHPHLFRHLRAQDLHDEGMEITLLQALLGHADISTTRRVYASGTDPQQLLDAVKTYGRKPEDVVERGEEAMGRK